MKATAAADFTLGADYMADNRLTAPMHMHVLDGHFLLPLSAVSVQSLKQSRVRARELVRLIQIVVAGLQRLRRHWRAGSTP
jgi:hypothetical protein